MATMAKKRPTAEQPSIPETPPGDRHKYPLVSVRPTPALADVLKRLAQEERRSVSQIVVLLLEEALKAKKLWPPPGQPPEE